MAMWNARTVIASEAKQSNEVIFLSHKEWRNGRLE
jgi:hypothetical protein